MKKLCSTPGENDKVLITEVSQVSRPVSKGNTGKRDRKVVRNRGRSWCFTLNNYTDDEVSSMSQPLWNNMTILKMVFQKEKGENSTPHLQGVVQFCNQVSFTSLKEFNNRVHWSKCRNLSASIKYCSKESTRDGDLYRYGDVGKYLWKDKIKKLELDEILNYMKNMMIDSYEESFYSDLELDI